MRGRFVVRPILADYVPKTSIVMALAEAMNADAERQRAQPVTCSVSGEETNPRAFPYRKTAALKVWR